MKRTRKKQSGPPLAIAAPNAVPIERTEAKAEAVLRCSSEVTLYIARATRCTL
jgi:hypothetical protein